MPRKTKFGCLYGTLKCPHCGADLTRPGGVEYHACTNLGRSLGEHRARLAPVGPEAPDVGELDDDEGLVEAGKHSRSDCGACGETLAEYECPFDWAGDGYAAAKRKAVETVMSWPEEADDEDDADPVAAGRRAEWDSEFAAEYARRTGITPADGGVSDDELAEYYARGLTPAAAVSREVDKYGLADHAPPAPFPVG